MTEYMNEFSAPSIRGRGNRKATSIVSSEVVKERPLSDDHEFLILMESNIEHLDFDAWIRNNRQKINDTLISKGAILFRNFSVGCADQFRQFTLAHSKRLLQYTERAAARREISKDGLYVH